MPGLVFTSADTSIVTVDSVSGLVTPVGIGTTTINVLKVDWDEYDVPVEVKSMKLALEFPDNDSLSWPAQAATVGGYDVVQGDLAGLQSGNFGGSAWACNYGSTSAAIIDTPAVGQGFFYLLRPVYLDDSGSYDPTDWRFATVSTARDPLFDDGGLGCP